MQFPRRTILTNLKKTNLSFNYLISPKFYNGAYTSNVYELKIIAINSFLEYYSKFSLPNDNTLLQKINEIQEKFLRAQEDMDDFLIFVDEDLPNSKKVSNTAANISIEDSYKYPIVKSEAVLVENLETGYKKVQILRPSKITILNNIKSKYEIK